MRARRPELRVIEQVKELCAEWNIHLLSDISFLDNRELEVINVLHHSGKNSLNSPLEERNEHRAPS